jgi:alkanesulfonate monooxygenase SsuD/methylene tetrahydromethanopterin reductase-like flavin-dependent oxidoreductase (luciferase family)
MDLADLVHPKPTGGESTLKFSIYSQMGWPDDRSQSDLFKNELDQLSRAESQGYYCAWLAEHRSAQRGIGPAIHLSAANLAARTRTIRIGTAITILPFMHPLRIAEEVAMLDIVSEGRVEWSVGQSLDGDLTSEQSNEIFSEQLEIIQKAWTGNAFAHAGAFYQFDELQCFPNPVQQPGPTTYIASDNEETIKWAARMKYSIMTDPSSSVSQLEKQRRLFIEASDSADVDAGAPIIPTLRRVYVGESMQKAREEVTPGLLCDLNSDEDPEASLKLLFDQCAIVGDVAYCRDRIAELRESLGLSHLIAWQNFGNLSHEQTLASQERLITQVAPAFA